MPLMTSGGTVHWDKKEREKQKRMALAFKYFRVASSGPLAGRGQGGRRVGGPRSRREATKGLEIEEGAGENKVQTP